jgi:hypothetical protein
VSHGHLANTTSLPNGAGKLSIYVEKTETWSLLLTLYKKQLNMDERP